MNGQEALKRSKCLENLNKPCTIIGYGWIQQYIKPFWNYRSLMFLVYLWKWQLRWGKMLKEFTRVEVKNTEKLQTLSIETFKLSRMCQVSECSQKKRKKAWKLCKCKNYLLSHFLNQSLKSAGYLGVRVKLPFSYGNVYKSYNSWASSKSVAM